MTKKTFYAELAYLVGTVLLALGTALMTVADFGISMVVAPAYILHVKISELLPFFSFGMAEYTLQAVLLIIMIIAVRRFKISYLFSFFTAVIYGVLLDIFLFTLSFIPTPLYIRIIFYAIGFFTVAYSVALLFKTYISPEVYELLVKEISDKYHFALHRFKTAYDISSLIVSIVLSFTFFGFGVFVGISWGTLLAALFNGTTIRFFEKLLDKHFIFKDGMKLRCLFEK